MREPLAYTEPKEDARSEYVVKNRLDDCIEHALNNPSLWELVKEAIEQNTSPFMLQKRFQDICEHAVEVISGE